MTVARASGFMRNSLPREITDDIRSGRRLAGDDYSPAEVAKWVSEEKEAFFADDSGNSHLDPFYAYMRFLTITLATPALQAGKGVEQTVLVLGPGPGLEAAELVRSGGLWRFVFVETSENFRRELAERFPAAKVIPASESGALPVATSSVDFVLSLSVLHHIANVSFVLRECTRVLRPGGFAIIREPCSSMGDWRYSRMATPNERGISKAWMLDAAIRAGLALEQRPTPVLFHPLSLVTKWLGASVLMCTKLYFWTDLALSRLVSFNDFYWRDKWYKKIGPSAYLYVFRKPT